MKKLIALLLALLLLTGCSAGYDGPTETVWALTEITTEHISPATGAGWTVRQTLTYDAFGNVTCTRSYRDGELTEEKKKTYDDRGNLLTEVIWEHDALIPYPRARYSYTYDGQNRLLCVTYRNGFGIQTGSDTYTYDDEANTVTWEGTYDTQTKYLNENGDPIRVVTYSQPAGVEMEDIYEYDALGCLVLCTSHYDGALSSTTRRRYDEQGRITELRLADANGVLLNHTVYTYGENIKTETRTDGYTVVTTYHPDGRIATVEHYNEQGDLSVREQHYYQQIRIPAKEE